MYGQQNIKVRKISCVYADGIRLAPDEEQCWTVVNNTVNFGFHKRRKFLTKSATDFSRKNLLAGVVARVGSPPLFCATSVFIITGYIL